MATTFEQDIAPGGGGGVDEPPLPTDFEGPNDPDRRRQSMRRIIEEMHIKRYGGNHNVYLGTPAGERRRTLPVDAARMMLRRLQTPDFHQSLN
jgi:hypothetical protein